MVQLAGIWPGDAGIIFIGWLAELLGNTVGNLATIIGILVIIDDVFGVVTDEYALLRNPLI